MTPARRKAIGERNALAKVASQPALATKITASSTKGATVYTVWYQCPQSGIFQTYSGCATMAEACADARHLREQGV